MTDSAYTGQLVVLQPGPLSLVQDQGRKQVQHLGISQAGSLDNHAYQQANAIVGNSADAACIEITLGLFKARFEHPTKFALAGANCNAKLNGQPIHNWASVWAKPGDTLALGGASAGARAYLAIEGGVQFQELFGSQSMNPKEVWPDAQSQLHRGDCIRYRPTEVQGGSSANATPLKMLPWYQQPDYTQPLKLRLHPCYQFQQFSDQAREALTHSTYQVHPHSDRMGYRLSGPVIHWHHSGIGSEPIAFGSVQIPPSGQPMVLLNDRQTLGGYPKIGCIHPEDCWQLAQRQAGQAIQFTLATL